jgi:hypothetical protein
MAEKLDEREVVTFKEILMANTYQADEAGEEAAEPEIEPLADPVDEIEEVTSILRYVWKLLQKSHRLRVVK